MKTLSDKFWGWKMLQLHSQGTAGSILTLSINSFFSLCTCGAVRSSTICLCISKEARWVCLLHWLTSDIPTGIGKASCRWTLSTAGRNSWTHSSCTCHRLSLRTEWLHIYVSLWNPNFMGFKSVIIPSKVLQMLFLQFFSLFIVKLILRP